MTCLLSVPVPDIRFRRLQSPSFSGFNAHAGYLQHQLISPSPPINSTFILSKSAFCIILYAYRYQLPYHRSSNSQGSLLNFVQNAASQPTKSLDPGTHKEKLWFRQLPYTEFFLEDPFALPPNALNLHLKVLRHGYINDHPGVGRCPPHPRLLQAQIAPFTLGHLPLHTRSFVHLAYPEYLLTTSR